MVISIAHLGPAGTYAEAAALAYADALKQQTSCECLLCPYPTITQTLEAAAHNRVQLAVVPVENSVEGSVPVTLDALWQLDKLQVQQALVLPISHALISHATTFDAVRTVYSHPQALAQCQGWLERFLPQVQLIPTNSTAEALQDVNCDPSAGAIASQRAAALYRMPILAHPINDYPGNCTRFWVTSLTPSQGGSQTSLAFSVPDVPGALVQPLQIFAKRNINLSRIESRPTKHSLGKYLFFIDLDADARNSTVQAAIQELRRLTEVLKIFGSYHTTQVASAIPPREQTLEHKP